MQKIIVIILFFLCLSNSLIAQECYWSSHAGGNLSDHAGIIGTDKNGNVYISGSTQSQRCYFNTDTLLLGAFDQSFIVKYDVNGNEVWIKPFSGPSINSSDGFISVGGVIDTIDNEILAIGNFYNYLSLPDTVLYGRGLTIFVMKIDLDGHVIWARTGGGDGDDFAFGITYDEQGNVYISGSNEQAASFSGITIQPGGFIAEYNSDGSLLWVKKEFRYSVFGGTEVITNSMCMSKNNLILSGDIINDTIIVDTIIFINPPNPTTGYFNSAFIASFSQSGNIKWMKLAAGSNGASGSQMAIDDTGNVFITGSFYSNGTFGNDTLIDSGAQDSFLAKYRNNGGLIWVKQLHSKEFSNGRGVAADANGSVYMTGDFSGIVQLGNDTLISGSLSDMFLAHFSSGGVCIGVKQYTYGHIGHFTVDSSGNIYLAGSFQNTLTIGPNTFTSFGSDDMFVAKCSGITGIEEKSKSQLTHLIIYANPNTGKCNITIPDDFIHEKKLVLKIFNINGTMIQNIPVVMDQDKISINISAEAKGMYNATLSDGKKSYSGKIIFE